MTKKWIKSCWLDFNILTKIMKGRSQNMNSRKCWMPKDRCENSSNSELPGPTLDSTLNPYLNGNLTGSVLNRSFITPKKVSIHLMNIWKKKWLSSTKLAIRNWILKSSKIFVKQFDWTMMSLTPKRLRKIRFAQGTHINKFFSIDLYQPNVWVKRNDPYEYVNKMSWWLLDYERSRWLLALQGKRNKTWLRIGYRRRSQKLSQIQK